MVKNEGGIVKDNFVGFYSLAKHQIGYLSKHFLGKASDVGSIPPSPLLRQGFAVRALSEVQAQRMP